MAVIKKPLDEIYFEIIDAIKERLKNDERLKEINTIIFGERMRIGKLLSPAIWIVPEPYQPSLEGGHTAQHDIAFNFVTLVKGNDPETCLKEAQRLALVTYDVIIQDRTLNGLVSDVRPTRVDPAYEAGQSTQLYWSSVQMVFRLKRRE